MKRLLLIRHAKSSWKDNAPDDSQRPLNKRGKRDAPFMGKLLAKESISPQLIVSSPAVRAFSTATIIAKELNYPHTKIVMNKLIYDGGLNSLFDVVKSLDNELNIVFLFGHNPGLTIFSNFISDKEIDNIPTCGIVGVDLDISNWEEIDQNSGHTFMYEYPKKYFNK